MPCNCASPDCPERHGIRLSPVAAQPSHDAECESELTSHGYTPCRCHERAGICYCRKNPCECLPDRLARLRVADLEGK
jgi:hypothetical protein